MPDEVIEKRGKELIKATARINKYFVFKRAKKNGVLFFPVDISFKDNELYEVIETELTKKAEGKNGR